LRSGLKLKNGVSLIRIYIRRPISLEPILNAVNANTAHHSNPPTSSPAINIVNHLFTSDTDPSPLNFHSNSMGYSLSTSNGRPYHSPIQEDIAGSPAETTGFETDRTGDISSPGKTETSSMGSSISGEKFNLSVRISIFYFNIHLLKYSSLNLVFKR
jgi:hypothetical protein